LVLPEKAIVLDERIQVAKYSNMRKTKSAQPDHDTECIKPSQLYDFYFANMDLILWLKPGIPFDVIVTTDVLTMLGKLKAVFCALMSSYSMATTTSIINKSINQSINKMKIKNYDSLAPLINILYHSTHYHFH